MFGYSICVLTRQNWDYNSESIRRIETTGIKLLISHVDYNPLNVIIFGLTLIMKYMDQKRGRKMNAENRIQL